MGIKNRLTVTRGEGAGDHGTKRGRVVKELVPWTKKKEDRIESGR